ncbi:multidrug efflux transporter/ MFS family [Synechococcus sp. MEDNS5]|uniref:MFS transporter n=1 Tax=Synechococcus sp. MEDNS5 TaxID=1442554 RepID=UPI0016471A1C|nr:MFS transporter [Synechococcus sp. MEDNS5]QNJ07130.1 multidrug efflux transporter/ MFS family [Synechococcus sp. MEDNS5]
MSRRGGLHERQRIIFLIASGVSTAGSFAGLTAKGWILMDETAAPMVLALHFAALSLPTLLVSGPAGVRTDRIGCETVLIQAQWALLGAGLIGAVAIPWLDGLPQVLILLASTLLVGIAGAYELTARNKYCALLVDDNAQLAPFLTSFSVVFNVGKLVGPPIGGWLVTLTGPATALTLDAATYLLPIASVIWLLHPRLEQEQRSTSAEGSSLAVAWRDCGSTLRHVVVFTGLMCVVGFFHPGLAPLIAAQELGTDPMDLGLFTSVLALGSIAGGLILQRNSHRFCRRPSLTLAGFGLVTAVAQLGMARGGTVPFILFMTLLIGAGTAGLLSSSNLMTQVGSSQILRGRMAGLSQIAFLGGGGISGLIAAQLSISVGLPTTFAITGGIGVVLALIEIRRRGSTVLTEIRSV